MLERHGRSLEGPSDQGDTLVREQPVFASCYAASAGDVQPLGAMPGARTAKLVRPVRLVPSPSEALAEVGRVNIHAKVVVDGRDRKRLERLCRSVACPPLNQERLELHPDGRARLAFKAAWKDGTHAVLLDPLDFIARSSWRGAWCATRVVRDTRRPADAARITQSVSACGGASRLVGSAGTGDSEAFRSHRGRQGPR